MKLVSKEERSERRALRLMMRLPSRLILRALRKRPIIIDGHRLKPEIQLMLTIGELKNKPGLTDFPPAQARERFRRDSRIHGIKVCGVKSEDIVIPGLEGRTINARSYRLQKQASQTAPLLVYLHGGGFVLGDIESYDPLCRYICKNIGVQVLSVDYRLAPENPYPAGLNDSLTAFRWVAQNAVKLNADPTRIAIGGDSAGANFATIIAQMMHEKAEPEPFLQLLIYPTCDRAQNYPSETLFSHGFVLTKKDLGYFQSHYSCGLNSKDFGDNFGIHDPSISPIYGKSLAGIAPAIIVTAGFDPLRDEGEAYAMALQKAGTEALLLRQNGLTHGFINMIGFSPAARRAFVEVLKITKQKLNP